jgi:glycosyltransferase involved in cell wall biosynthesis
MRLLFLVSGVNEVSCRFRVLQYLPYLRERGIDAEVMDLHTSLQQRYRTLLSVSGYDAVCVHRVFLSPLERLLLRRAACGYVYDFDDAIMFRDSSHPRLESWQRRRRFARMVVSARVVIAGNAYLAGWASRYNPRVVVIPTTVDLAAFPEPGPSQPEHVIGWIGTRINQMYLREALPAVIRLSERRTDVRLKVVSDGFADIPGLEVIRKYWSLAEETRDLLSFRVGIMPLPDDVWTRGKCAVKILQYFAAGVPVVCSPVGANVEVVRDGVNGYFARTDDEWADRLDELLNCAATRDRLARLGRETVEQRYATASTVQRLVDALHGRPSA